MEKEHHYRSCRRPLRNQYDLLLYQHSARCSSGLQRFLGKNPSYWCFIPQLNQDVKVDNDIYFTAKKNKSNTYVYPTTVNPFGDMPIPTEQSSASSSSSGKPMFFAAVVADLTRTKEETQELVRHLPDPPLGYDFSHRQREEQAQFFQMKKENCVFRSDFVDLYIYSMVAVCMYQ